MKHGGKRDNAGRKATGITETKVVRVDAALIPSVNEMKDTFKETGIVPCVTFNQDDLKESYEARLELLQDSHNLAIAKLKAKPLQQQPVFEMTQDKEQALNAQIDGLQVEADELRKNYQVIINLNKQQDKEIAQLKEFGAPQVSKTEIDKLKKIMSDKEAVYHSITGDKDAEIKRLKAKPPKCQAIKRNGEVCGKPAPHEVKEGKRMIHLCSLHHKPVTA